MGVILRFIKKLGVSLLVLGVIGLLALVGFYLFINYDGNFYAVKDGEIYRSAQLDAISLQNHISTQNIKTVVNLRGANPDKDWYKTESSVTSKNGVTLIDIPLSSSHRIKPDEARAYVELINQAQKPVLIHCLNGSDRTGFISAVYLIQNGVDEITASQQLAIRYGHFPHGPWVDTKAMDESLNDFIGTLLPGTD